MDSSWHRWQTSWRRLCRYSTRNRTDCCRRWSSAYAWCRRCLQTDRTTDRSETHADSHAAAV